MEDITDSFISTIIKNSQLFENPLQRSGLNTDLIDYPWLTFEDVVDFSTEVPPGGTVGLPYLFPLFSLLMAWKVQKVSKSILFFLIYTRSEDLQDKLFSPPEQIPVSPVEYCSVCYPSVMGATGTKEPPAALSSAWPKRRTRIFPTADGSSPLSLFRAHNTSVSSPERGGSN